MASELGRLYEAAGRPGYRKLAVEAGQCVPPVALGRATLGDWIRGKAVPSDPKVLKWVVEYLEERARQEARDSAEGPFQSHGWTYWEKLRDRAEKKQGIGDPPKAARAALWKRIARHRVTQIVASMGVGAITTAYVMSDSRTMAPTISLHRYQDRPQVISADGTHPKIKWATSEDSWNIAYNTTGLGACPKGSVCLFQNPNYDQAAGWMLFARRIDGQLYELPPPYDKAMRSWANKTTLDVDWYPGHGRTGEPHHMPSHSQIPDVGADTNTASSVRFYTDACAFGETGPQCAQAQKRARDY
ncbi:peptidase inhibitor family I36 protein [Actinoallomurus sp. NPDC050550]|uniref:peptidase inhibitor family I36 protein n=1 Tax=Actinoallomurus sp. NPDC050550 TaxID=3154937 RepID=UPI0033ED643F